jgi:hypothetical protein
MPKITAIVIMVLLICAPPVFAKKKVDNSPFPKQQIQIDPGVLAEHQKRFGPTIRKAPPLNKRAAPAAIQTEVGRSSIDTILEMPVLPKMVGDVPYAPKYKWGKQPTLSQMLQTKVGPRKNPQPDSLGTKTTIEDQR